MGQFVSSGPKRAFLGGFAPGTRLAILKGRRRIDVKPRRPILARPHPWISPAPAREMSPRAIRIVVAIYVALFAAAALWTWAR